MDISDSKSNKSEMFNCLNIVTQYKCKCCHFMTPLWISLNAHIWNRHKSCQSHRTTVSEVHTYTCRYCDFTSYSLLVCRIHERKCEILDVFECTEETGCSTGSDKAEPTQESFCTSCNDVTDAECNLPFKKVATKRLPEILRYNNGRIKAVRCKFCNDDVDSRNFVRHLGRKHKKENEVKKILDLPINSLARKHAAIVLRNNTNFSLFLNGEIRFNRRHKRSNTYYPCMHCKGLYTKRYLGRHTKRCLVKKKLLQDCTNFSDSPIDSSGKKHEANIKDEVDNIINNNSNNHSDPVITVPNVKNHETSMFSATTKDGVNNINNNSGRKIQKRKITGKCAWSKNELDLLTKEFGSLIRRKCYPPSKDIRTFIEKYNINRSVQVVKSKIQYLIKMYQRSKTSRRCGKDNNEDIQQHKDNSDDMQQRLPADSSRLNKRKYLTIFVSRREVDGDQPVKDYIQESFCISYADVITDSNAPNKATTLVSGSKAEDDQGSKDYTKESSCISYTDVTADSNGPNEATTFISGIKDDVDQPDEDYINKPIQESFCISCDDMTTDSNSPNKATTFVSRSKAEDCQRSKDYIKESSCISYADVTADSNGPNKATTFVSRSKAEDDQRSKDYIKESSCISYADITADSNGPNKVTTFVSRSKAEDYQRGKDYIKESSCISYTDVTADSNGPNKATIFVSGIKADIDQPDEDYIDKPIQESVCNACDDISADSNGSNKATTFVSRSKDYIKESSCISYADVTANSNGPNKATTFVSGIKADVEQPDEDYIDKPIQESFCIACDNVTAGLGRPNKATLVFGSKAEDDQRVKDYINESSCTSCDDVAAGSRRPNKATTFVSGSEAEDDQRDKDYINESSCFSCDDVTAGSSKPNKATTFLSGIKADDDQPDQDNIDKPDGTDVECNLLFEKATKRLPENLKRNIGKIKVVRCKFCNDDVDSRNFVRHLERKHKKENEVKKILDLPINSLARKQAAIILRNDTKFTLFLNGEIRLNRRQNRNLTYSPCTYCKGLYVQRYLRRHTKRCFVKTKLLQNRTNLSASFLDPNGEKHETSMFSTNMMDEVDNLNNISGREIQKSKISGKCAWSKKELGLLTKEFDSYIRRKCYPPAKEIRTFIGKYNIKRSVQVVKSKIQYLIKIYQKSKTSNTCDKDINVGMRQHKDNDDDDDLQLHSLADSSRLNKVKCEYSTTFVPGSKTDDDQRNKDYINEPIQESFFTLHNDATASLSGPNGTAIFVSESKADDDKQDKDNIGKPIQESFFTSRDDVTAGSSGPNGAAIFVSESKADDDKQDKDNIGEPIQESFCTSCDDVIASSSSPNKTTIFVSGSKAEDDQRNKDYIDEPTQKTFCTSCDDEAAGSRETNRATAFVSESKADDDQRDKESFYTSCDDVTDVECNLPLKKEATKRLPKMLKCNNGKMKVVRCKFCNDDVDSGNFVRHLGRKHKEEDEVQKILDLPKNSLARKQAAVMLRNDTNFLLFLNGEIRPSRKPNRNHTYSPCTYCKGLYARRYLRRHTVACFVKKKLRQNCTNLSDTLTDISMDPDVKKNETFVFSAMKGEVDNINDNSRREIHKSKISDRCTWSKIELSALTKEFGSFIRRKCYPPSKQIQTFIEKYNIERSVQVVKSKIQHLMTVTHRSNTSGKCAWTREELDALTKEFGSFIQRKCYPSSREIEAFIEKYNTRRSPPVIKSKIQHLTKLYHSLHTV